MALATATDSETATMVIGRAIDSERALTVLTMFATEVRWALVRATHSEQVMVTACLMAQH